MAVQLYAVSRPELQQKGMVINMSYTLDLSKLKEKHIYPLDDRFRGSGKDGAELSFTNYYQVRDGKPYFGNAGEFHFSRTKEDRWEREILKMKACGLNTISTYMFWIHHEEEMGVFDFSGRKDLRKFISLCGKHSMNVILRIGPYSHGECRNGGFPDWMFAQPFEMRKISDGYLYYVKRYFSQIGEQTKGLYYKDGGPIMAVQIDNEFMHASSLWNFSRGTNLEFIFGGDEGDYYLETIRDVAISCGITPVYFTATAWGGAITPESMMPMWGGYCFRPWMRMPDGKHPKTDEFVYQDFHRNGVETTYDFHPTYEPESKPYGCCEIGAGMMVGYSYRCQYPYKSVDAIGAIKIASGCNFLGYYMYHGGSHPLTKRGDYTNDGSLPKISYDYQAAIGEFGQVRESGKRSKTLHYFSSTFGAELCPLQTVLPEGASQISPEDMQTLRYAVRTDGRRGFLFINNFQDHAQMPAKVDENILLKLKDEELNFPISIAGDENAVLPFHMDLDGIELKMATAQPVTVVDTQPEKTFVFFVPQGLEGCFVLESSAVVEGTGESSFTFDAAKKAQLFTVVKDGHKVRILVVNRPMADAMYLVSGGLVFTDAVAVDDGEHVILETYNHENRVYTYPQSLECTAPGCAPVPDADVPVEMNCYLASCPKKELQIELREAVPHRYLLKLPEGCCNGLRDVLLRVDYMGDIGNAFLNCRLISDNYANGSVWEIGLSDFKEELDDQEILLYISPVKKGARIIIDNQMAAEKEVVDSVFEKINSVTLAPVYDIVLR